MASADNPILNSPYDEPARHYATDAQGNLNYRDIRPGRRIFTPDVPQVPIGQQNQGSMFDVNDFRAEYGEHLINRLRDELRAWRQSGYRGVTSRVTRDLLDYWFANPERAAHQKLFFAQQEAVEAAIWLNEVAEKSNTGTHLQTQLRQRQASAGDDTTSHLPRVAFKMATGSGKTVVMACLILYHYLNRREYRNDTRYVDYFLILAPGITIRDRLNVLLPDQRNTPPATARDYYQQRTLVPPAHQHALDELAHRLIITNYHEFLPRLLGGNKRTPFDGKLGADGHKVESREDENQMLRRVLGSFKAGRRLLVINDEAHHCYLPRARGRDTELDNSETENERAAVWFSGLRACTRRFQVRVVYDLSATPYYLSGSGFPAYSLFPWVVSDFGLIEAIEAGLVKIPFLPIDDSSQAIDEPVLKKPLRELQGRTAPQGTAHAAARGAGNPLRRSRPQPAGAGAAGARPVLYPLRRIRARPAAAWRTESRPVHRAAGVHRRLRQTPPFRAKCSRKSPVTNAWTRAVRATVVAGRFPRCSPTSTATAVAPSPARRPC
jgi:type III restriction enzyme